MVCLFINISNRILIKLKYYLNLEVMPIFNNYLIAEWTFLSTGKLQFIEW